MGKNPKKNSKKSTKELKDTSYDELIQEYTKSFDWPNWFKGLSLFQIYAADSLQNCLRDDMEQGTIDRVHTAVSVLGVDPMIKPSQLKAAMVLSRGNDIAFLFFMWRLYYLKSGADNGDLKEALGDYSQSEKILLTTISHLDTVTTLRALDKILPVQVTKHTKSPIVPKKNIKNIILKASSPYFESLPRPQIIVKKNFKIIYPKAKFNLYPAYADSQHVVANESNRWYMDYNVNPSKKLCIDIINKAIVEISKKHECIEEDDKKASPTKCPTDLLEHLLDNMPLCETHKQMLAAEKFAKNKLRVQKFKGCLRNLNPGENRKEAMRRKVLKDIDKDVNAFQEKSLKELNKEHKIRQKKLQICNSPVTVDCNKRIKCQEHYQDEEYDYFQDMEVTSLDSKISSSSSGTNINVECDVPLINLVFNEDNVKRPVYFQQLQNDNAQIKAEDNHKDEEKEIDAEEHMYEKSKVKNLENKELKENRYEIETERDKVEVEGDISNYDYGHFAVLKSEDIVFKGPSYYKPYKFMFDKIFNQEELENKYDPYKTAILKALGGNETLEEDEALNEYCKTIWKMEINESDAKYKEFDKLLTIHPHIKIGDHIRAHYDPHDNDLMDNMLLYGINELRKDKRFVLATLPQAHKMPILKEWIRVRYGLVHTTKSRQAELKQSLKVFHALKGRDFKVKSPNFAEMVDLSYNCRDYIFNKSARTRKEYSNKFREEVLNPIPTIWKAIRPYSHPGGPPRATFFTYMPFSPNNIMLFKPWKLHEFKKRQDRRTGNKRE